MKRKLLFSGLLVLATIATAVGQNVVAVTTRPGTANDNGSLLFWCQFGAPGTVASSPFSRPVPISMKFKCGSYVAVEAAPNSFYNLGDPTFYGDFVQGDCLLGLFVVGLFFNQGVSQVGAQFVPGHPGSIGLEMTAYDINLNQIGNPVDVSVPYNRAKQDGSAPYFGIADLDTTGHLTPGIYFMSFVTDTGDPVLMNELSITVPNNAACYTPPNTTMVAGTPSTSRLR